MHGRVRIFGVNRMDRQEQIELLAERYRSPRYRKSNPQADVIMPGGNPGCGDVVTIYLTVADDGKSIADVTFEGEGCTISQAAADLLIEAVREEGWSLDDVLSADYHVMEELLGSETVQLRPRCATLALGTLKAAVTKFKRDRLREEAGLAAVEAENAQYGIVTGEAAHDATQHRTPH